MRGNLDMKQHHERNMGRAFNIAWDVIKSYEIDRSVSRDEADHMAGTDGYGQGRKALSDEAAEKANDFHTARREAMRPNRSMATVADPSQYLYSNNRNPFLDLNSPKINPFPGTRFPTIHENMAEIKEGERIQDSVRDLVSNYEPEHMSTSERNQPTNMGSTAEPPKSDRSPQGSFPMSMGPTRQQKRGEMGRGVAVKRPGFRSSEAMPIGKE
jgi:hypothetical protein